MTALATAAVDPDAPIPEGALVALEGLLQVFVERGNRRLRIDAKAALGVLPRLYGASPSTASAWLANEPPTRKPQRLGLQRLGLQRLGLQRLGLQPLLLRSPRRPQA
jgi:hypothetical protein